MAFFPWHCPRCRRQLLAQQGSLICHGCNVEYPLVSGIPDLRINAPAWVDQHGDRARAMSLLAAGAAIPAAELARQVFASRRGWSEADICTRAAQTVSLPDRMVRDLDGWLRAARDAGGPILDLGCGAGGLLAAIARDGRTAIGIDVSMEWLVVARRLIAENGGTPVLAAAMAESLPLADRTVGAVISLDVIEHVGDQAGYLREIDRVLRPGGVCAVATPNRFSLAPEPHVGLWGVGWLPRQWQQRYVEWRSSKPYAFCRLLSVGELRRMFKRRTSLRPQIKPGLVPAEEIRHFSRAKTAAALAYNRVAQAPILGKLLLTICPFFRVIARKPGDGGLAVV